MKEDFDYQAMLAGQLYQAAGILPENSSAEGKKQTQEINHLPVDNREGIIAKEKVLFGKFGQHCFVQPPLFVDYGRHVEIGDHFYANMDCIFLDVNKILIGVHVMVGPRVSFYAAGHPIDSVIRSQDLEFGLPITVEDYVWIGVIVRFYQVSRSANMPSSLLDPSSQKMCRRIRSSAAIQPV